MTHPFVTDPVLGSLTLEALAAQAVARRIAP
jgi:hypothetical protein